MTNLTPAGAIADPNLLGGAFAGESWGRWIAILKAAYAEPLIAAELALFREVAERDPPTRRVRELWAIAGRRGGKDSIASAIAAVAAMGDYRRHLRPGERATVMCLAVDREQARIVHRYIAGYFNENPLLRPLVERETDDGLELNNGVEIIIATNSFRSVRGRTIVCVIFDEVAFWRDDDYANPDQETYNAVVPGLVTIPGAMLIGISTPYARRGLLFDRWRRYYGQPDDDVLVVRGPSTAFNPLVPQSIIDDALARDPEAGASEWLAEWRSDISDFLDRELVEAAVDPGVIVRPPDPAVRYTAFGDPSGGRGSAFTVAIGYAETGAAILACLYERRAPFDPDAVVAEIAALLRGYGLTEITGDRYAAQWVVEAFAKEGIAYRQSERDRSAIYLDALPLFTAGRARLLDNSRLIHQFVSLERRTSRAGKDRIDHGPGGADDLANAAAGALVNAASEAAPALWRRADLLAGGRTPVPWPVRCPAIFCTAAVDAAGIFVCFWALGADRYAGPAPLILVDYDRSPLTSALFSGIAARLARLAAEPVPHPAGYPVPAAVDAAGICCPPDLQQHARAAGLECTGPAVITALQRTRPALLLAAAQQLSLGAVKIAAPAAATAQRLPLPLAEIRPDAPPGAPADAVLLGVGNLIAAADLRRLAA